MKTVHRVFTPLLLTSTALFAQSVVFPSTMTNVANGNTYMSWFPFSSGISRMQAVYEAWDLGLGAGTQITRIGFRQDGSNASTGHLVQLEVRMGTTVGTASTLSTNFDNNFATGPVTVFPQAVYTLPTLTSATSGQVIWINLTTPYTYPGGNLLVEYRVYGNNNGNQSFTYYLDQTGFVSTVTAGVQGCLNSGGQRAVLHSQPTQAGGNWSLGLSGAPANTAIVLLVAPEQAMPAPFGLGFLGLDPSCMGQIPAAFIAFSATSNSGGNANWTVPVPNMLAFNNYIITSQALAFDFFVPGALVTSNADQVQFGIAPPESIVYSQGNASATTGQLYANYGVVTLFN